MKGQRKLYN